jgi:hypothetical protein
MVVKTYSHGKSDLTCRIREGKEKDSGIKMPFWVSLRRPIL